MRILFVHQNMPGQFGRLATALAADTGTQVAFVTQRKDRELQNVLRVSYDLRTSPPQRPNAIGARLALQSLNGVALIKACRALQSRGFQPDVIIGHPGWGELLFVKDLLPNTPLVSYCEFYHRTSALFFSGDPPAPLELKERMARRADSAHLLLTLEAADRGWSPTQWQRSLHPTPFHDKIEVIFDGVDTTVVRPDATAQFELPNGRRLGRDDEVVTYAARALEPCRGFPTFMRALPDLMRRRPNVQVVIAGQAQPHYEAAPAPGETWKDKMLREVGMDLSRVHFVGNLPHAHFIRLLQVSRLHVHLSTPITLSWSLVEAMSAGCAILASNTPPVLEVIRDGENGFLADFDDPQALASRAGCLLDTPNLDNVRRAARDYVKSKLSLQVCLPRQMDLIRTLARGAAGAAGTASCQLL